MNTDVREALGAAAEELLVTQHGGVVTIELHRPDKHNAISYAMWLALARLLPVLAEDATVQVVVLRGTPGGPFSAGADIGEFRELRQGPEAAARYSAAVEAGEQALISFARPTIALVEGFAIGGGTQLAVACDVRVCGQSSRFGITPARLGIVYPLASTARLVQEVGAAWARMLLLTGELLDASAALRIGLVHEVAADGAVAERAYALAATLCVRAQVSLIGGKALVARAAAGRLAVDDDVQALYRASWDGAEYAEGVAAFLAKRQPDFPAARSRERP